ncbi:hypothetical protein GN244_ATG08055 [Phytophthora infestans]|uniref:MARVEL domain-containing protein n=1 Tax=Phytophthora infestans TaxID=4787 RepID=A0A833WKP9_PHYIN|nr:hypothetical protein GN244_ATG08055 [Phytophthora infestans]KAF4133003.1 hypothetical protein GN958_ATG17759 [Phytophthora infestans]KAI9984050.1 hypothetical protein PInf_005340 [Phytophthora infestans]
MRLAMAPYAITLVCILLRGLQLTLALVSLITATMSFPMSITANDNEYRLGSSEATFVLLVSYTIVEYSGVFLGLVELFPVMLRPRAVLTRVMDSVLAIFALISGVTLASSDYVQHCDDFDSLVHCSNLKTASVCVILSVVPLMCSVFLTFVKAEDPRFATMDECRDRAGSYRMVTTPVPATLSPIDNRDFVMA